MGDFGWFFFFRDFRWFVSGIFVQGSGHPKHRNPPWLVFGLVCWCFFLEMIRPWNSSPWQITIGGVCLDFCPTTWSKSKISGTRTIPISSYGLGVPLSPGFQTPKRFRRSLDPKTPLAKRLSEQVFGRQGSWSPGGFVEKPLNVSVLRDFFRWRSCWRDFTDWDFFEATQKRLLKRLRYRREW